MAQTTENAMDAIKSTEKKKKLRQDRFGTKIEDMTPLERSQAITGYDLRRRIEALVAGVTGKKIKTHFHGTGACTGEDIMILPSIPQTHLFLKSEAMTLLGYAAHEISHQLETDFDMIVSIFQDIKKPTKKEIQLKEWWNAIEDYRIEKLTRREYPGFPIYIGVTRHYTADRFVQMVKDGHFPSDQLGNPYRIGAVGLTWVGAILNGYPTKANEEALRLLDDPLEQWLRAMSSRLKAVESKDDALNLAKEIIEELEQNQKSEDKENSENEDSSDQDTSDEDSGEKEEQRSGSGENSEDNQDDSNQKSETSDCDSSGNNPSNKNEPSEEEDSRNGNQKDESEKSEAADESANSDKSDESEASEEGEESNDNDTSDDAEEGSGKSDSDDENSQDSDKTSSEEGPEADETGNDSSEDEGKGSDKDSEDQEKSDDSNPNESESSDGSDDEASEDKDASKSQDKDKAKEDSSQSDEDDDGEQSQTSGDGEKGESGKDGEDSEKDEGAQSQPQNKNRKPSAGNNMPAPQTTQEQAEAEPEESDLSIEEILEALSKIATHIDNAMTDIHEEVCTGDKETIKRSQKKYAEIKRTLGSPAARSAGIVRRLLIAKNKNHTRRNLEQGKLDLKRLVPIASGSSNVYYERTNRKDVNSAVSILVDNSGSMSGEPLRICQKAAIVLDTAIQGTDTDLEIMGFTGTSHNPVIYQYRKFGQKGQASAASLGTMDEVQLGGTPVAIPILEAHRRLMAHKAPRKILVVISDGAAEDQARAKEAHDIAVATGCLVFGIGIGSWAQGISGWCDNHQMIQDINDLPGALSMIVQTALNGTKRKAA